MNGDVIKEFLVSLGLQVEGADGFNGAVNTATMGVAALGAVVVGAAAAMFGFTKTIADEFDALSDLAALYNTTADSLQELGYVASLTDSSLEASNASIGALAKNAGDAALGLGRAGKTFDKLGIQVKDGNGKLKNSTDLLYEVGDAIKGMESGEQLSIMQRLGIDRTMLAAITTDVGGLREEFRKTYEAVGLDTNAAAEASSKFMDSITRLGFVTGAVGKSLAVTFMPRFTESMDKMRKLIIDNLPKIMSTIKPVIGLVLSLVDVFIALAYQVGVVAGTIIGWLAKINDATDGWAAKILVAAAAWKYLNLSFLASPVGMIIALAAAVALLVDDFQTWKEGGDSLVDWAAWQNEITLVTDIINVFVKLLENSFTVIFGLIDALVSLLSGDFTGAWIAAQIVFETVADSLSTVFGPALDMVKEQFRAAFAWIQSIIDSVMGNVKSAVNWVKNAASSASDLLPFSGAPALAPSASSVGGGSQTVSQQTQIIVQGSNNPDATAAAVAKKQSTVNGDMVRNMKGAVR